MHKKAPTPVTPEWIRLPRFGDRCPYTGLTRNALDSLTRPQRSNRFAPPVLSRILKIEGDYQKTHGARLINYKSLMAYLDSLPTARPTAEKVATKSKKPRRQRVRREVVTA